jgi:hypothetical protein
VNALDPDAVLGLFTYGDDDHEIDIEFSRWGRTNNAWNAQFVVQPWQAGQLFRWNIGPDAPTTHTFTWTPYAGTPNVQCMSIGSAGNTLATASLVDPTALLQTGQYLHMNLWLFEGKAPRKEVEVVISDVRYAP